jgi:alpha-1,3-mannosyltransferase
MQEVEGWLGGDLDYKNLRGDTGPLVYPAGFVYLYSFLRFLTNGGRGLANIKIAQYIFAAVYVCNVAVVSEIYKNAK